MESGNIWSGDKVRAAFTNPTELAFRKGSIKEHYPIMFRNTNFKDAEEAYQYFKDTSIREELMVDILKAKLRQHPSLIDIISESGGASWIRSCSHTVYNNSPYWEGKGLHSRFIRCLLNAYIMIIEANTKCQINKRRRMA